MKPLNEVIKAMENCYGSDAECCDKCSYTMEVTGHGVICRKCDLEDDALHYLKELRDMTDIPMEYFENGGTLQNFADTSQITCPKCHSEFVILPDANNPLTWDELKQMKGKPVWIEVLDDTGDHYKWRGDSWYIVKDFAQGYYGWYCHLEPNWRTWTEQTYGDLWQAYRKERR